MKKVKSRWVVKAGSNMICSGGPMLIRAWMAQVAQLRRDHGVEIIWVSSGAIASAMERTQFKKTKRTLSEMQALSAIGQPMVMDLYNVALQTQGCLSAQVLLTYFDLSHPHQKKNLQNTIEQLLTWDVTPIINENDTVATEEIRFGDNDSLSARIAKAMKADRLVVLTDVNGLYDSDPRKNPKAKLVPELERVTPSLLKKVGAAGKGGGTSRGTGGMFSKLSAAKLASDSGIETILVKGDESQVLLRIAGKESIGTRIGGKKRRS
jgi:glutamate 5-kinase